MSIQFDHSHLKKTSSSTFPAISMLRVSVQSPYSLFAQVGAYEDLEGANREDLIMYFEQQRNPIYYFKDPFNGHCFFDICYCKDCAPDMFEEEDKPKRKERWIIIPDVKHHLI